MMNPVLRREAITTMRNWKTYGALMICLCITSIGAALYIYTAMYQNYGYAFSPSYMLYLYGVLGAIQMGLVALATPAIAAGSISGERERQTLDLLLVTKMSPLSIILGKMASSLMYIMLLVVSVLPVFAVSFYFGTISIVHVVQLFLFVLCTACMIGSISVFFSCYFKKTIVSIVLMYLVFGVLCFGTLIVLAFQFMAYQGEPPLLASVLILIPNPGVGFFSLMDTQMNTSIASSLLNHYQTIGTTPSLLDWMVNHLWLLHIIFDVVLIVLFTFLSTRAINPLREHKQRQKKQSKKQPKKQKA